MSRAWIYDEIKAGRFPRPVKIGVRASAWLESEVTAFLEARTEERAQPR
jgi:prophage regulatory protein